MPDTELAVSKISIAGKEATYYDSMASATGPALEATTDANRFGHSSNTIVVPNDGRTVLHVKNAHSDPTKLTFQTPGSVGGNAVADREVTVAANDDVFIGPFPRSVYGDELKFTMSEVHADIDVAALSF